jgi:hypothetical protein
MPIVYQRDAAETQPAGKLVRIGILHSGSLPDANIEALRSGLRQRGYVEGRCVGLLWHPGAATSPRALQELERAAE